MAKLTDMVDTVGGTMSSAMAEAAAMEEGQVGVQVFQDHHLLLPELFIEVFIVGDKYEQAAFAPMFARARCSKAESVETADLVVFTGGVDVDPCYYGERPHVFTETPNTSRDLEDASIYITCLEMGIPMLGICRGAQFIHVMNGGKLFQHVDGHNGDHKMLDVRSKDIIERVSSVHHQMVIPQRGMEIIGVSGGKSSYRWRNDKDVDKGTYADVEAFFYRDICAIGIQGHPEYTGYNKFQAWALDLINECVMLNPDTEWLDRHRRLNPDIIKQREEGTFDLGPLFNRSVPGDEEVTDNGQTVLRLPPPLTGNYAKSGSK